MLCVNDMPVASSARTPADGRRAGILDRIFGAPSAVRDADLLPVDQPLRPTDQRAGRTALQYNGFVRLLVFGAIVAAAMVAIVFVATMVNNSLGFSSDSMWTTLQVWVQAAAVVAIVVAYWVVGRFVERRRPLYELAPRRAVRGLASGIALGVVLMAICAGCLGLLGVFRIEGVNFGYSWWSALLTVGLSAAVTEEILFRGILFRFVEAGFGTWAAIAVSAVFFGAGHLGNPQATLLGAVGIAFEAGILFAALYAFTRSLWTVMGLHFAWNVVQGPVLGIVVSGTSTSGNGFLRSSLTGPEWLSGGSFGIEASTLTIVVLTAVGIWLLVAVARRGLIVRPFWVRRRRLATSSDRIWVR